MRTGGHDAPQGADGDARAGDSLTVLVTHDNGGSRIVVAGGGVAGADAAGGSGFRGLADRIAALEGTLTVESPPGGGTRVSAEIPLESAPQE